MTSAYFEEKIRPILVTHCYECHSEEAGEQSGGLLLDRRISWLTGGNSGSAIIPGKPEASLLFKAVRAEDEALQMPPDTPLQREQIQAIFQWIKGGAPGPSEDLGETSFSRLGDQNYLFEEARSHWAFQPVNRPEIPESKVPGWTQPIDRFVSSRLLENRLTVSATAAPRTLLRRLSYDLTGLPPTLEDISGFEEALNHTPEPGNFSAITEQKIDELIDTPQFGQHFARLWLDVVRYADTDSTYRPDTKTPYYFPFAFAYRDYVVNALNADKPFDQFVKEQLAADLMGFDEQSPEIAALGFLAIAPYANRSQAEVYDDWIDVTMRGLMGVTVACARCHDHKFEPIPTEDYYALRGIFASLKRVQELDEKRLPKVSGYQPTHSEIKDYEKERGKIDTKIAAAAGKKSGGNNRPVQKKLRDTELALLLAFHPGAPSHAMIVTEQPKQPQSFVLVRGDPTNRGARVPRRFLEVLAPDLKTFPAGTSGRLQLAEAIVASANPLTARVIVNRVWGYLIGSHLVSTDSDFGLQASAPTHPELLDWLTSDFVDHEWSIKHLVRTIVRSKTYQQASRSRNDALSIDPENRLLWRSNRSRLSIEQIRDSLLEVTGQLDKRLNGRPEHLWGPEATYRRALYGFINRFNLDPTLRAFDFPARLQSQPARIESIVAPQALFALNSPIVIRAAKATVQREDFTQCSSDEERAQFLFQSLYQRNATREELQGVSEFLIQQKGDIRSYPDSLGELTTQVEDDRELWELIAQSMLMSNEFQYID